MSCSPAFKWFVGLLLPLTLAWKLAAISEDPSEVPHAIARFLTQRAFDDVKTQDVMGSSSMWVVARTADCRLFVFEVTSNG